MTTNHDYNTPRKGATDWHEPLNENFELFDVDVEVRDTDGNRGRYDPVQGAKFFATDTGAIYLGDGDQWLRVPSSGENPAFTSLTADTLALKTGQVTTDAGAITISAKPDAEFRLADPGTVDVRGDPFDGANVVAGHALNRVAEDVVGATVAGGGASIESPSREYPNVALASFATVGGGRNNEASGQGAAVGGGRANLASGRLAVALGGDENKATADLAAVGGGRHNQATGRRATVSGGGNNKATGGAAAIGGGSSNDAEDRFATVGGGLRNEATIEFATIAGGKDNDATGPMAALGGGVGNNVTALHATVGGGYNNTASGEAATVSGGKGNDADGEEAAVGGGWNNNATGEEAVVGGGGTNNATAKESTVGGGSGNEASGPLATVGGGFHNESSGKEATVGGGAGNTASGRRSTVPGGSANDATGEDSFAAGQRADALHENTFVWNDGLRPGFDSTAERQFLVNARGGVGLGTNSPEAPLDVAGENNWNLDSNEGDVRVGDDDYRLCIGVSLGGAGRGTARLRAKGTDGNPKLKLGAGDTDTAAVTDSAVKPVTDGQPSLGTSGDRWSRVYAQSGTVSTSDERLKTDVTDVSDGLDAVRALRPVAYSWDADADDAPSDDGRRLGFLAQEVADVVPEAVEEPGDEDGYYGLDYDELVPVLTAALQEQQETIDDLEAEVDELRGELAEMKQLLVDAGVA